MALRSPERGIPMRSEIRAGGRERTGQRGGQMGEVERMRRVTAYLSAMSGGWEGLSGRGVGRTSMPRRRGETVLSVSKS